MLQVKKHGQSQKKKLKISHLIPHDAVLEKCEIKTLKRHIRQKHWIQTIHYILLWKYSIFPKKSSN